MHLQTSFCWGSKSLCVFTCSLNSVSLILQKLRISYFLSHGFTVFSKCSLVCQFLCFLQLLYSFFPARIDLPTNGGRNTNFLIHNSDTPHLTWASNERRKIEIESLKENVAMVQNSKTHEWKERGKLGREDDNTWIRFSGLQMTWLQNLSLQGHEQHVDEHGGSESTVSIYLIKKQKLPDHNQV